MPKLDPAAAGNYPVLKDKTVIAAAKEYRALVAEEGRIEMRKAALKDQLIAALGGAPKGYAGDCSITVSEVAGVAPTPERVITLAMLGETIPGSRGRSASIRLAVR